MIFFFKTLYRNANLKMFRRLQDAIDTVTENDTVIAEDVSSSGQKQFRVNTIANMDKIYRKIQHPHWYECLLENRPSRIFLDIESYQPVDLGSILESIVTAIQHKYGIQPEIQVLDSSSEAKNSWHLVVSNVYLKNVYHVGAFVRRLVLATGHKAIDTAVYTKNRMFRIAGSSKFGSERVLKHSKEWHELLVQDVSASYLECLEIDGSEPFSSSQSPFDLFYMTEDGWKSQSRRSQYHSTVTTCSMLEPILQKLDQMTDGGVYRHKCRISSNGMYVVPTKSKNCAIAGRCHKGNNIYFVIDLGKQRVSQRCHDSECTRQAHEISIESELWTQWHSGWSAFALTPKNENTLYNISN